MLEKQELRDARNDQSVSAAESQLADRLDRLSAPLAESVLARAIDLHHEEELGDDDGSVSYEQLTDLASELGIEPRLIRQALLEQLDPADDDHDGGLFEKLFGPKRISGGIVAEADAEPVANAIAEWMKDAEGMHQVGAEGATEIWEGFRSGGRLAEGLKSMGAEDRLKLRRTELSGGDQLLEIEIAGRAIQLGAGLMFALCAGIGLITGGFSSQLDFYATGLVRFLIPAAIGMVLGTGSAWVTARHYTGKVRKLINRTLDGIVHKTTFKRRRAKKEHKHGDEPDWSEIVDEIYE